MNLPTDIRLAIKDDLAFIKDSWTKSMKYIYPNQYALDFTSHYQDNIDNIISNSVAIVSFLRGHEEEIISYLVYKFFKGEIMIAYFGYTKADARKQNKLNDLIRFANPDKLPIVFTAPPKNETIMKHFSSKYIFDPTARNL